MGYGFSEYHDQDKVPWTKERDKVKMSMILPGLEVTLEKKSLLLVEDTVVVKVVWLEQDERQF